MPTRRVNGVELYYEDSGPGPESLVFAHGLLWSGRLFDGQMAALAYRYRCITFDFRGQGQSEVTESGYDMESLTSDAASLIESLHAAPCYFVGLSAKSQALHEVCANDTGADYEKMAQFVTWCPGGGEERAAPSLAEMSGNTVMPPDVSGNKREAFGRIVMAG